MSNQAANILNAAQSEANAFLSDQKMLTMHAQQAIQDLLLRLQPDIEAEIAGVLNGRAISVTNLDMLRGQLAVGVAGIILDALHAERAATNAAITSIIMAAIKVGIGAAAGAL